MAKAYLFDVFGTIVDWRKGIATQAQNKFSEKGIEFDPNEFADLWRSKYQPAMEKIRSGNRGYVPLDVLHRENLEIVLSETGMEKQFSMADRVGFARAWEKLPPWPDSVTGLSILKNEAIIAPCSNGSIALMTHLAKFAKLPWDCILGAEIARNYKPHPDAYLKSVQALGLQPADVVMVAAHNDDLVAAREAGLKTAFICRPKEHGPGQQSDLEPSAKWDRLIGKIGDLALS